MWKGTDSAVLPVCYAAPWCCSLKKCGWMTLFFDLYYYYYYSYDWSYRNSCLFIVIFYKYPLSRPWTCPFSIWSVMRADWLASRRQRFFPNSDWVGSSSRRSTAHPTLHPDLKCARSSPWGSNRFNMSRLFVSVHGLVDCSHCLLDLINMVWCRNYYLTNQW